MAVVKNKKAVVKKPAKKKSTKGLSLPEKLKQAVEKSLILNDEDKNYWIENCEKLPSMLVEYFYKYLKEKNDLIDLYIKTALESDKNLVTEMKSKVTKLRSLARDLIQSESEETAEETLKNELTKI